MTYIRVPAVWDKLRLAEETFRPVLMLATAGWGKTAAADYYYRKPACPASPERWTRCPIRPGSGRA